MSQEASDGENTTDLAPCVRRRGGLAGLALVHGLGFGVAAALLPWREYLAFGLLTTAVALGHLLTAGAALLRPERLPRVWRATAWLAVTWLFLLTWSVATSALYVARLYGALGAGVAVALAIGWCIPLLFTVPLSSWALAATPPLLHRRPGKAARRGVPSALLVVFVLATAHKLRAAETQSIQPLAVNSGEVARLVRQHLPRFETLPALAREPAPLELTPYACEAAMSDGAVTLFLQYRQRDGAPEPVRFHCIQRPTLAAAIEHAAGLVKRNAARASVKLDLVTGTSPLTSSDVLLDALKLRPGLDGACADRRCLLGWQLAARDMLNENTPVSTIPELRMGFSTEHLRLALTGNDGEEPLTRVTLVSLLFDGEVQVLSRLHPERQQVSPKAVRRAEDLAERHITAALGKNGRFRYELHPFTGKADVESFNLPRQAGTTLVLCELGQRSETLEVIEAALQQMARLAVKSGEKSVLVYPKSSRRASLGHQALPLIAFLSCRDRVGKRHDRLIGRLASTLLALQTPRGDFHPGWDLERFSVDEGAPPLFSPGQAVMALVLLEPLARQALSPHFPDFARVHAAVDKAMHYYGTSYWDFPLGKLFYLEENWHCLAARAALPHHRVDPYERFCIEHAEFKARFIVGDESPTADMRGAFALAALIPPPNTATAGVGEALAAAIALKQARQEDTAWSSGQLKKVMEFLLRQQWDEVTCFACADPSLVAGGFSDSMLTPTLRIDFTQHAWAAVGHGARVLGLARPSSRPAP
ncbi:MAG TPA: hypothetical protein VI197_03125 [Polyangiaceae bacterium]